MAKRVHSAWRSARRIDRTGRGAKYDEQLGALVVPWVRPVGIDAKAGRFVGRPACSCCWCAWPS
jgi:hypothetical protein